MGEHSENGFKLARQSCGISETELAFHLKVDIEIIKGWESGTIMPTIEVLLSLSRYFNVSTDFLLFSETRNPLYVNDLTNKQKASIRLLCSDLKNI